MGLNDLVFSAAPLLRAPRVGDPGTAIGLRFHLSEGALDPHLGLRPPLGKEAPAPASAPASAPTSELAPASAPASAPAPASASASASASVPAGAANPSSAASAPLDANAQRALRMRIEASLQVQLCEHVTDCLHSQRAAAGVPEADEAGDAYVQCFNSGTPRCFWECTLPSDDVARTVREELAGQQVLTISDVRFDVCEAVSWMPMGHVRIIIRNLHPQFMRKGATAILLTEAGYEPGACKVVRENAGALPAALAARFPRLASPATLVALVLPPAGDPTLERLPRRWPGYNVDTTVKVESTAGQPLLPAATPPAPAAAPHPPAADAARAPNRRARRAPLRAGWAARQGSAQGQAQGSGSGSGASAAPPPPAAASAQPSWPERQGWVRGPLLNTEGRHPADRSGLGAQAATAATGVSAAGRARAMRHPPGPLYAVIAPPQPPQQPPRQLPPPGQLPQQPPPSGQLPQQPPPPRQLPQQPPPP